MEHGEGMEGNDDYGGLSLAETGVNVKLGGCKRNENWFEFLSHVVWQGTENVKWEGCSFPSNCIVSQNAS
jgi:hypothetical protein